MKMGEAEEKKKRRGEGAKWEMSRMQVMPPKRRRRELVQGGKEKLTLFSTGWSIINV